MVINLFEAQEPEIDEMDAEQLRGYLCRLRGQIESHDLLEPEDQASEAYEDWGDRREELEDLVDDVLDRLDELNGD